MSPEPRAKSIFCKCQGRKALFSLTLHWLYIRQVGSQEARRALGQEDNLRGEVLAAPWLSGVLSSDGHACGVGVKGNLSLGMWSRIFVWPWERNLGIQKRKDILSLKGAQELLEWFKCPWTFKCKISTPVSNPAHVLNPGPSLPAESSMIRQYRSARKTGTNCVIPPWLPL